MPQSTANIEGPLVTQDDIAAGVREVDVGAGDVALVHTSLKAFGWVCGGPVAIIKALETVITRQGTIVMPAFSTNLSDPAHWSNPPVPKDWWPRIRETMPAYDRDRTPTIGLGLTPEVFLASPDVKRGSHPQASFAAWGEQAETVASDHRLDHGFGDGSPLRKLYDLDAKVLFLGTGYGTCTAFHLGEWRAGIRPVIQQASPMVVDGLRQWVTYEETDYDEAPFADLGTEFEKHHAVAQTRVGLAKVRAFSLREAVDFAEEMLLTKPNFLRTSE